MGGFVNGYGFPDAGSDRAYCHGVQPAAAAGGAARRRRPIGPGPGQPRLEDHSTSESAYDDLRLWQALSIHDHHE